MADINKLSQELKSACEKGDMELVAHIKLISTIGLVNKFLCEDSTEDFVDLCSELVNATLDLYRSSVICQLMSDLHAAPDEAWLTIKLGKFLSMERGKEIEDKLKKLVKTFLEATKDMKDRGPKAHKR